MQRRQLLQSLAGTGLALGTGQLWAAGPAQPWFLVVFLRGGYDAANLLIAAMQKADSADPAKYLPELQKISYQGATGKIEFDDKAHGVRSPYKGLPGCRPRGARCRSLPDCCQRNGADRLLRRQGDG